MHKATAQQWRKQYVQIQARRVEIDGITTDHKYFPIIFEDLNQIGADLVLLSPNPIEP
jgi:hypothetical protein